MGSDEVQTLIVTVSVLVGGMFGFMFGIMYALRRILELRVEVQKAVDERSKLIEMLHQSASNVAIEAAESDADEPEERPAGPTPKKRTEAIRDDASASRDTEGRNRAREDDPVPVPTDDQRRDET